MNTDLELQQLNQLKRFATYEGEDKVIPAEELLAEILKDNRTKKVYNTQFPIFNNITGGFRRGQLIILSAPTGQGKTSFAQTLTKHFIQDKVRVLWFSYEIGIEEFMEKMPKDGRAFFLPKQIKQNSLDWLKQRIYEGIAKYNTRIIFIDHLHYLLEMQKMAEAKSLSLLIGMMLRNLKRLAIDLNVCIFLISHMKKIEINEKPDISDLRDSSFVSQESDMVIMLWRETDKIDGETVFTNRTRVSIKKNRRTGKLGTIIMEYVKNEFIEKGEHHSTTEIDTDEEWDKQIKIKEINKIV